jgi:hypothetical protein
MAEIARDHGVDVEVAAFEAWDAAGRTFDRGGDGARGGDGEFPDPLSPIPGALHKAPRAGAPGRIRTCVKRIRSPLPKSARPPGHSGTMPVPHSLT